MNGENLTEDLRRAGTTHQSLWSRIIIVTMDRDGDTTSECPDDGQLSSSDRGSEGITGRRFIFITLILAPDYVTEALVLSTK